MMRRSKSSPPRNVSPAVLITLNTPSRADLEDRDVERAAAEVVDRDRLSIVLAEAVRERGRGRLVDDADDVEAGDRAGVLGGLTLVVVEVRRDGDDRLLDLGAEVVLGDHLHLLQDHRADLGHAVRPCSRSWMRASPCGPSTMRYGQVAIAFLHLRAVPLAADQALGRVDRVLRVGDGLALGDVADQALA